MGQQIPESWVQFEKILTNLVDRGIIYARVEEVRPTMKLASLKSFTILNYFQKKQHLTRQVQSNFLGLCTVKRPSKKQTKINIQLN
jgi:hypothetical protein